MHKWIHIHAGPGDYLLCVVYTVSPLGIVLQSFDLIVYWIEKAIIRACEKTYILGNFMPTKVNKLFLF
jgi:hypothetical protein